MGRWLGALAITVAACALVHDHTRLDSASVDEPAHIHAGYLQVFHGNALSNMEHPPLAKEAAGLGLLSLRPADAPFPPDMNFPASAHRFLFENTASPDAILAAARAPMLLFFAALCLLVFAVARRWFGTPAGFAALLLVAFEPLLLAHAGIVHTDVPVSLFWLASVVAWGRVLNRRSPGRVAAAGVFLGLALATKFSALYLLPTFALVAIAVRALESRGAPRRLFRASEAVVRDAGAGIAAAAVALATAFLVYLPVVRGFSPAEQQAVIRRMIGVYERAPQLAERVAAISPWSRALAQLAGGIALVARQSAIGGGITFLNGRLSTEGFPFYFFEAFAVKTGLPLLAAAAIALGLLVLRRADRRDAILWVPVAYYFIFSIGSSYNIGVRHILPVYPLLAIASGRMLHDLASRGAKRAVVGAALGLLAAAQAATALSSHPFELSYFNVFGGGTARGYRLLADSNVDWGLDLRRLAAELDRRGARDATISYLGGDDVFRRTGVPDFAADPRPPGSFVAISTTMWDIGPAFYAVNGRMDLARRLAALIRILETQGTPAGQIGGSTLLFRLPRGGAADSAILPQTR